jgi:predicted transposase/invertase (TIGR01784 family)
MFKKIFKITKLYKKTYYRLLNPKNEIVFKRLFGTEKNKDLLIDFINSIVQGKNVSSIQFLKTQKDLSVDIAYKKESIIDVLCQDKDGSQYIIQMQVAKQKWFAKRAQFYAANAYSNQIQIGEEYHKLKEIIFIAITDFIMFPEKKEFLSNHVILDEEIKTNDFSFTFLELPKFNKKEKELENKAEKWFYFIKYAPNISFEEMKDLIGQDQILQKAFGEIKPSSWTNEELNAYEARIKYDTDLRAMEQQIIDDAEERGKEEGIKEGLSKITELTKDEISS